MVTAAAAAAGDCHSVAEDGVSGCVAPARSFPCAYCPCVYEARAYGDSTGTGKRLLITMTMHLHISLAMLHRTKHFNNATESVLSRICANASQPFKNVSI